MARIRTIKPEFFTSESVLSVSPLARLFFIGLWCEADREGRLKWKPKTLKFRYLPGDSVNIESITKELSDEGMIMIYVDDGNEYCWIPGFQNHQVINNRETKSIIEPHPLDNCDGKQPAKIPQQIRNELMSKNNSCFRCGSNTDLTIDHILPQSAGGKHIKENLRVMCRSCNSKRPVQGDALEADLENDGFNIKELRKINACRRVPTRESGRKEGKEGRERKGSREVFTPPTYQEVFQYCLERKNGVDAQRFIDHYQSNGWKRGNNKIKDWKACVRTWESNQQKQNNLPKEFSQ